MSMSGPIRVHPHNPKTFDFQGKPLVLITATEHYGAVLNRRFRFERYLADVAEKGITLTRLFVLFRELQTAINPYSTCKPESPDYVAPFKRTGPGKALDGESKYDLDQWNPEFFERLHGFLSLASEYGVIVEVTFLSNTYAPEVWALNPLHHANNINALPQIQVPEYLSTRHRDLFERQVAHVRKIVQETNEYENIFYELCNEPGGRQPGAPGDAPSTEEVDEWLAALARVVRETEASLPSKHLIAGQRTCGSDPFGQVADKAFSEPDVDIVNVHPHPGTTYRGRSYDMGGFMSKQLRLRVLRDYCLATYEEARPLNLDEDNIASEYRDFDGWTIHRKRAWMTLMCGCHYDYIDFSIQSYLETGTAESQCHIRTWMKHLAAFIHSADLVRAHPLPGWLKAQPEHALEAVLAVEEEDYCIYLADERELDDAGAGTAISGEIIVDLPSGSHKVTCYSPTTGLYSPALALEGAEDLCLEVPPFEHDLVVRITRV